MADEMYPRYARSVLTDQIFWWLFFIFIAADAAVIGLVAYDNYQLSRQNGLSLLPAVSVTAKNEQANAPVRYNNDLWKAAFDLPPGYAVAERTLSAAGDVEVRVLKSTGPGAYADTSVAVWIGKDAGFSRYYVKPYTEYGDYRRLVAVGRPAVSYDDPSRALDAVVVTAIDDSRNGREVRVEYSAIQADAESTANALIKTLKLGLLQQAQILQKEGWKTYISENFRFQYPEDYRVTKGLNGVITVQGAGGKIEIWPNQSPISTGVSRAAIGAQNVNRPLPDDFFDLNYEVDLRVNLFYASADAYQRSVIKDISKTISLNQ